MFRYIKQLFRKKEPENIVLNLDELRQFFNENAKKVNAELEKELSGIKQKIVAEMYDARQNLKKLADAELRNPNISVRERQFMQGNRDAYIKMTENLLKNIDIDNISKEKFQEQLEPFAKSTMKAYRILQNFFANETKDIAINIKNLEQAVDSLEKAVKQKGIQKLRELRELISQVKRKKEHMHNLALELKEKRQEKDQREKDRSNLRDIIVNLKQSNEYQEYLSLLSLKKKAENEYNRQESRIIHMFTTIDAALKKYSRITLKDVVLLDEYIIDPLKAFLKDEDLKIAGLLEGTRKNVMNGTIALKDRKREKTLEQLRKMDHGYLKSEKQTYVELCKTIKMLGERISRNNSRQKLDELKEKEAYNQEKLESLITGIGYLQTEIEKIDFRKPEIEQHIEDIFDIKVQLKLPFRAS